MPAGQTGYLLQDSRSTISGSLTGGGEFTLRVPWIRNDWFANCSDFTGTLTLISDACRPAKQIDHTLAAFRPDRRF